MHIERVDAVYEQGVLRPLHPINLADNERVSLIIAAGGDEDIDECDILDYASSIEEEGDPGITWEQVQAALAKLPGSLCADFDRERDERF